MLALFWHTMRRRVVNPNRRLFALAVLFPAMSIGTPYMCQLPFNPPSVDVHHTDVHPSGNKCIRASPNLIPVGFSCDDVCGILKANAQKPAQRYPVFIKMHKVAGSAFGRVLKRASLIQAGLQLHEYNSSPEGGRSAFGHCAYNIFISTGRLNGRQDPGHPSGCNLKPVTITIMRQPLAQRVSYFLYTLISGGGKHKKTTCTPVYELLGRGHAGLLALRNSPRSEADEAGLKRFGDLIGAADIEAAADAMIEYHSSIAGVGEYPSRWVNDFMHYSFGANTTRVPIAGARSLLLNLFTGSALADLDSGAASNTLRAAAERGEPIALREIVDVAQRGLERFDVVMLQEHFSESLALVGAALGWDPVSIERGIVALSSNSQSKVLNGSGYISYDWATKILWVNGTKQLRSPKNVHERLGSANVEMFRRNPWYEGEERLYAAAAALFDKQDERFGTARAKRQ